MKDRIKKFYHDHENTINIVAITAGITTTIVAVAVANAADKQHKIVNVDSVHFDGVEYLLITKKNGQVTDHFQRALTEE